MINRTTIIVPVTIEVAVTVTVTSYVATMEDPAHDEVEWETSEEELMEKARKDIQDFIDSNPDLY